MDALQGGFCRLGELWTFLGVRCVKLLHRERCSYVLKWQEASCLHQDCLFVYISSITFSIKESLIVIFISKTIILVLQARRRAKHHELVIGKLELGKLSFLIA